MVKFIITVKKLTNMDKLILKNERGRTKETKQMRKNEEGSSVGEKS